MTKRTRSADEIVIDWLNDGLWNDLLRMDIRLRKVVLKGGFTDWLIVITAIKDDENVVTFIGGGSLLKAARKLNKAMVADTLEWKPDKYAD